MNAEFWNMVPAWLAGMAAGAIFFGGLWWTVRRVLDARFPALVALLSFAVRAAAVLVIFYLAGRGQAGRVLVCLLGFLMVRLALVHGPWGKEPESYPLSPGVDDHETES